MQQYEVYEKMEITWRYRVEAENATQAALAIDLLVGDGEIVDEEPISVRVVEYTPPPPFDPNQLDIFIDK